jgi:hypothetical protein
MERINITVIFADKKIENSFNTLKNGDDSQREKFKYISQALDNIKINPYCGIRIPERLIPKEYIKKYCINNLFKYDLPRGLRLLYSVQRDKLEIITIILEYLTHKDYEKRFKYII